MAGVTNALLDARGNPDEGMCRVCGGTGLCAACNGDGRYYAADVDDFVECYACDSSGRCAVCEGMGREPLEANSV
jgi:primosomal protein N'